MSSPRDGVEFEVKIGESITRQNHPGFHLLKYEFKPGSIDPSLPGRLSLSQKHASVYLPEKNGQNAKEFRGTYKDLREDETECFLQWDPETETFTLEKLSASAISLRPTRKKADIPLSILTRRTLTNSPESPQSSPLISSESEKEPESPGVHLEASAPRDMNGNPIPEFSDSD